MYLRLQTLRISNTYSFPTATTVCTNDPQCYVIRTLPISSSTHACLRNGLLPSGFLFPPLRVGHLIFLDLIMLEGSTKYESLYTSMQYMQSSSPSRYLLFLRCTYSSHHPVLTHPHFASDTCPIDADTSSHNTKLPPVEK